MRCFIHCLYLFAGFSFTGIAAPGLVARPDTVSVTDLTRSVGYFSDSTRQLTLAEARQQAYQPTTADVLNFRFSPDAVWLRFTLQQSANAPHDYVLELTNWYIDEADLHSPQPDGRFLTERAGGMTPLHTRAIKSRYPAFAVHLPDSQPHTFYLRLTNSQYNNFTIKLWPRTLFFDVKLSGDSADFVLGLIAMRLVFHVALLLFLFSDQKFRAYSLFGISICLIYFFSDGNGAILFPNSPYLANGLFFVCLSLIPASLPYLVSTVLDVPTHLPRFVPVFWLFGVVGLVNLVALFGHDAYISWAFAAFMSLMLFTFLVVIGWLLVKGVRPTVWYMIPLLIYIPSFCLYYTRNAGLHSLPMTETGMRVMFFVEFLCMPFITAAMLRTAHRERLAIAKDLYLHQAEGDGLRQLDRAKTNFFTNISHEFRTPLTLIIGPLNDLRQRFPAEELYQIMHRNTSRLQLLINQLLDLAKVDSGQLRPDYQPGDLAADLRVWVASFESLATSRQIKLRLQQPARQYRAIYDADKTHKIIINLITNALKFTGIGGSVRVEARYTATELTLLVEDTGSGIAPDQLPYIFDRFYQVDANRYRSQDGTGVGLALVQELVRLLGGQIIASSQPGVGTTITVQLPLPAGPAELLSANALPVVRAEHIDVNSHLAVPAASNIVSDLNQKTQLLPTEPQTDNRPLVLIVEDSDDLREYIRAILGDQYRILEAIDGQQGLEVVQETQPDLIITDLMMPRLDGLELCRRLRQNEQTNHIVVVMLTARAALDDRLLGLEIGADDYLTKPFVATELLVRVQNLLRRQDNLRHYFRGQLLSEPGNVSSLDADNAVTQVAYNQQQQAFIERIYNQIDQQIEQPDFSVEILAETLAMSSRTLNRKLNTLVGMSAGEVIRTYRLRRAAELLRQGLSPTETAYRVGFENPSHFSRTFREQFQQSPSAFARNEK